MTTISRTDRILNWKFKKLDVNSDSKISKYELRDVEKQWNSLSVSCAVAVRLECDRNDDGYITWSEWKDCIGARKTTPMDVTSGKPSPEIF